MPCLATASSPPARDPLSFPAPQSWASTQKLSSPEGCPGSPINSVIPTKKERGCLSLRKRGTREWRRKEGKGKGGEGKEGEIDFLRLIELSLWSEDKKRHHHPESLKLLYGTDGTEPSLVLPGTTVLVSAFTLLAPSELWRILGLSRRERDSALAPAAW